MNLRTRLQKTADADFVREMIKVAAQRLMEPDAEVLTGTAAVRPARAGPRPGESSGGTSPPSIASGATRTAP
jgi:hypothetical protein